MGGISRRDKGQKIIHSQTSRSFAHWPAPGYMWFNLRIDLEATKVMEVLRMVTGQ